MTTTQQEATTTDLGPAKVGGFIVPKTVEALEALLEKTKTQAWPLPFRADILPPPVQRLLYSIGGIPEDMPPNYVMLFAGKPYVAADRFTAADISVAYIANGAKYAGIADDIPASVKTYVENLWQRPAYQRAAAVK
jgi:hypothetical protein